ILSSLDIEALHRELISLLEQSKGDRLQQKVKDSLKEYYYAELGNQLTNSKWEEADSLTSRLMLYLANRQKEGYYDNMNINSFSCPDLKRIDQLWVSNSEKRFGFSVQKEIWINTGNRLGIKLEQWNDKDQENSKKFSRAVGWLDDKGIGNKTGSSGGYVSYNEIFKRINLYPQLRGSLPSIIRHVHVTETRIKERMYIVDEFLGTSPEIFSRVASCKL
ncbi:MAG: GUN4 domain-containing protein, partial [Rhizonema sp. NSF051]|nr:GUN4 domain-containing protein [Rhizonema sp. NSF051]